MAAAQSAKTGLNLQTDEQDFADHSMYNLFVWMADHCHAVGISIEQYSSHSSNLQIKGWIL